MPTKKPPTKDTTKKTKQTPDTPVTRRPPAPEPITPTSLSKILTALKDVRDMLESYAKHMRPLDRKRLNSVGIKRLGFSQRSLELAIKNSEFLPHWLSLKKFEADDSMFREIQALTDLTAQIREMLWNLQIDAADVLYTDGLEFYASVREAAKRRVDAAEAPFNELRTFFKSHGKRATSEPTMKQLKKDFDALIHGKRDGKIEIENIKPKMTDGKRIVVDEKFQDSIKIRKKEDEEIDE